MLTTIAVLGLLEISARTGRLPSAVLPVSKVLDWLGGEVKTSGFWQVVGETVGHWGLGLAIGCAAGMTVGLWLGAVPALYRLLIVPFEFLRPIPAVIYLPLLLLVWGATGRVATVLTAVGAFWPMLFQTYYGVGAVDSVMLDTGKAFGLGFRQRLVRIIVPSVLPYVATGLRISASLALVVTVSVELVGAVPGIGVEMQRYAVNGVYAGVYGYIIVAGLLGVCLNVVIEAVEKRFLRWHPALRATEGSA